MMVDDNSSDLIVLNNPPPTLKGPLEAYYNGSPFDYVITNYNHGTVYAHR